MRLNYWQNNETGEHEEGISVSEAKKLLKDKGGIAFTYFIDRSGSLQETRQILLTGNNTTKVKLAGAGL